jgi:O-antigen ligase
MLTMVFILCMLVWVPLFFLQITRRGFSILLIWLLIAPVASNLIKRPGESPFFQSAAEFALRQEQDFGRKSYFGPADEIGINQLVEPTRTILGILLVVLLIDVLLKKKRLGAFDWTEIWMLLFSIILLAGILLQSNRINYSLRIASDAFVVPFLAYFLTRRLVVSEEHFRQLIRVIGFVGFSLIIFSLLERLAHQIILYRLGGPFRNATGLYLAITIAFFIALVDAFSSKTLPAQKRILPLGIRWSVLSLSPVIVFLTWGRGNWVGFMLGLCVFLFLGRRMISFSGKLLSLGLAPFLGLAVVISVWALAPVESIQQRSNESETVYGRIATWTITLQEGVNHPLFGIGLNNMRDVLARKILKFQGVGRFPSVHNSFLAIFAEQGMIGLLTYLAIIACIIRTGLCLYRWSIHSQDRWRGVTVISVMVVYLVPALFASTLHGATSFAYVLLYAFWGGIASLYGRHSYVPDPALFSTARYESIPVKF